MNSGGTGISCAAHTATVSISPEAAGEPSIRIGLEEDDGQVWREDRRRGKKTKLVVDVLAENGI